MKEQGQQKDLMRLCVLMYTKNELHAKRHSIRRLEAKYIAALRLKRYKSLPQTAKSELQIYYIKSLDRIVSKKLKRLSISELRILMREAHIANEVAKLDIAKFTQAHRKEMRDICKRNDWYTPVDSHSAHYDGLVQRAKPELMGVRGYIPAVWLVNDKNAITNIAITQLFEDAALNERT